MPFYPLRTPVSTVMSVLSTRTAGDAPSNTTSSTVLGGVTIWVIPLKSVITPQVPTFLASVVPLPTTSVELTFTLRVQVSLALADKPDYVMSCLALQWHMRARA